LLKENLGAFILVRTITEEMIIPFEML